MSNSNIVSVGDINERGYLTGMTRRGFTPAKCNLELAANTFDSHDAMGNQEEGMLLYDIRQSNVRLIDNAAGMNNDDIRNAFSMHRENHISESSRGVSGMGGKTAMRILSEDKNMAVYTKKPDGPYTRIDVPWASIISEGVYTGKVQVRAMQDDEKERFMNERFANQMCSGPIVHGTTIDFPTNDELVDLVMNNFKPLEIIESPSKKWKNPITNPLDRMSIIFGRERVKIGLKHFESTETKILAKYNYFGLPNTQYYRGVSICTIEQWTKGNEHRFLLQYPEGIYEINKAGNGFKKVPELSMSNTNGFQHVGNYEVRVGLRINTEYFDSANPPRYIATPENLRTHGETNCGPRNTTDIYGIDKEFLGDDNFDYLAQIKLYRNNMLIGLIPTPDVSISSHRANSQADLEYRRVQLDVSFNPLSTQNNAMDRAMNIQENKNQFDGKSVPLRFTRLLKWIRSNKAEEIWNHFTEVIALHQVQNEPSEDEEEVAPAPSVPVPAPAPASTNVLNQLEDAHQRVIQAARAQRPPPPLPESDADDEEEEESSDESTSDSGSAPQPLNTGPGRNDYFTFDTSILTPRDYADFHADFTTLLIRYRLQLDQVSY